MEALGFFGILRKSCTIINGNRMYYCRLAAVLLLPISFFSVFMSFCLRKIVQQNLLLAFMYMKPQSSSSGVPEELLHSNAQLHTSHMSAWTTIVFFLVQVVILILSLVSTIAISQGVCRSYFDKKSTLKSSLASVPKALRRLLLTALCIWVVLFLLLIGIVVLIVISILLLKAVKVNPTVLLLFVFLATLVMLLYLMTVWSLAYVASALEENWGWEAMRRSVFLVKGKRWAAFHLLVVFAILGGLVAPGALYKLEGGGDEGMSGMILIKLLISVIGLTAVQMYRLATTTVLYIQCKICHNEAMEALPCLRSSYGDFDFVNYMDLKSVSKSVPAEP